MVKTAITETATESLEVLVGPLWVVSCIMYVFFFSLNGR